MQTVTIPDSVESIGKAAFEECTGLKTVTIGENVTSIGRAAFAYCRRLQTVTIGRGVQSIGNGAFAGCISLKDIYYAGDETQWENIEKGYDWDEYYDDSDSDRTIDYQLHYNSTGPETESVALNEFGAPIAWGKKEEI